MVQRATPPRLHSYTRSVLTIAITTALCGALIVGLAGCSEPEEAPGSTISLPEDVLTDTNVVDVQRIDADSDGELEWIAFYRFDEVADRGPLAAVVYDVVREGPFPVIYPYRLRTPNETYLALSTPRATMVELVEEADGLPRRELLLSTQYEMAFYRVDDASWDRASDDPPLYRCIGFFRGDTGVAFDPESRLATVVSGAGYERSQLVTKHYYRPQADGYFVTGTLSLVPPAASRIEFPNGIPDSILDTPYPEKIVLAFYQTFGRTSPKLTIDQYLTAEAAELFAQGRLWYGLPSAMSLGQLRNVAVKELSYYPTQDSSTSTEVIVKAVFNSTNDDQSSLITIRWTLVRSGSRWRMHFAQP